MRRSLPFLLALLLTQATMPSEAQDSDVTVAVYRVDVGIGDYLFAACAVTATEDHEWGLVAYDVRTPDGVPVMRQIAALKMLAMLTAGIGTDSGGVRISRESASNSAQGYMSEGLNIDAASRPLVVQWSCAAGGGFMDALVRLNGAVVPPASRDTALLTTKRLDEFRGGVSVEAGRYGTGVALASSRTYAEEAAGHLFGLLWLPGDLSAGRIVRPDQTEDEGPVLGVSDRQPGQWIFAVDRVVGDWPPGKVLWILRMPEGP